jgi:hypothetical protein
MKVYALGVFQIDFELQSPIKSARLWNLYKRFSNAEKSILSNSGDLFEFYYNYALIEEITVIPSREKYTLPEQWWYHVDYSSADNVIISKIDVPKQFENTFCWWVG